MEKAIVKIDAVLPETAERVRFYLLTDAHILKSYPEEKVRADIEKMLKEAKPELPMSITQLIPQYGFVDQPEKIDYGNTIVEVNIPYCLHLPNGTELDVSTPEKNLQARVICGKIWTTQAAGSSPVDIYAEDRTLYFNNGDVITPKLPVESTLGWQLQFTGKNVEKIKDGNGYFRFTKLQILLKTEYRKEQLENKEYLDKVSSEIREKVIEVVNYFLDVYRYVTKEEFVERLGSINITNVYLYEHNFGVYPVTMNIQSAVMNRSRQEKDKMKEMLANGEKPPLYELLLLNSQLSFSKRMFTLSVVSSFQALEIFLENFLIQKYTEQGVAQLDIEAKLNRIWKTKERLKDLLKEATGHSLLENKILWDQWCTEYDQVRNEVIHRGKEIDQLETEKTLKLNQDVITWIKSIS